MGVTLKHHEFGLYPIPSVCSLSPEETEKGVPLKKERVPEKLTTGETAAAFPVLSCGCTVEWRHLKTTAVRRPHHAPGVTSPGLPLL
ncbi:unnamed protein product [Pylaiella littoralis]